jgi:hypothetical protein
MNEPDEEEPALLWVEFPGWPRLPDGSPEYILFIDDGPHARFALEAPFERYRRFRDNYAAVWSATLGIVECEIVPCDEPPGTSRYGDELRRSVQTVLKILGLSRENDEHTLDPDLRVRFDAEDGEVVSIGPSSDAYDIWHMDVYSDLPSGHGLEVSRTRRGVASAGSDALRTLSNYPHAPTRTGPGTAAVSRSACSHPSIHPSA